MRKLEKKSSICWVKVITSVLLVFLMFPNSVQATESLNNDKVSTLNHYEAPLVIKKNSKLEKNNDILLNYWLNVCKKEVEESGVFFDIPLYDQTDYPTTFYGEHGTVATHGCGITCVSMLTAYYRNKDVSPELLANVFGCYNTVNGSLWILFEDTAEVLDLPLQERTYDWDVVQDALENGQVVVSLQSSDGLFTSSGHFIILTKMIGDKIFVNDPNGPNYENEHLVDGFKNGFTIEQIQQGGSVYWIYEKKDIDSNLLMKKELLELLGV